ncbi:hypothetical protein Aph01nite_25750 [Acrocarpospora phusangensis]|uniref:HTH gntR-type domain-containing protein n=1 Tax=Acrocarpospora phusangensis TaxID=1070424 RepID=A0A919QCW6_9ACTN|nr:GntR family transcriptional regulator [Acrocarpospora phusangensis]GIH24265.1 hypothetical protein Aph01nite_25750 [Acrocarpospora phusangensis]
MLDREGPNPVYKQIADVIAERIRSGDLPEGSPIPSEAELVDEYGIARTTARRVARELREQGLAFTVQGEGTFVGTEGSPRGLRKIPRYQQIATELAERIRTGELPPNRPIPSEQGLIDQYGVSKVTARQAVQRLREQGWVFTVPHRGTYPNEPEKWPK